jgi:hypothetical protein
LIRRVACHRGFKGCSVGEEKEKEKDEGREYKKMNRKQGRGGDKMYTSTTGIGGKMADKKEYKPHLY